MKLFAVILTLCFLQSMSLFGQVTPTFGRTWGEAPSGLLEWAGKHKLDVTVALPGDSPSVQIFTFKQPGGGLPGHPASAIEARFFQDRLYELTVFYEYPSKTPDEVRVVFHEMKGHLAKSRGEFKLNGRSQNVSDGYLTREESFHHEPTRGSFLLMAYTSVEDTLRESGEARFSIIYHESKFGPPAVGVLPDKEE